MKLIVATDVAARGIDVKGMGFAGVGEGVSVSEA